MLSMAKIPDCTEELHFVPWIPPPSLPWGRSVIKGDSLIDESGNVQASDSTSCSSSSKSAVKLSLRGVSVRARSDL